MEIKKKILVQVDDIEKFTHNDLIDTSFLKNLITKLKKQQHLEFCEIITSFKTLIFSRKSSECRVKL